MLFDILVIGVLILFLNKLAEKRVDNRRYLEEIEDFRGWESEEAAYRIAGNLKRLKRNGYKGRLDSSNVIWGVSIYRNIVVMIFWSILSGLLNTVISKE